MSKIDRNGFCSVFFFTLIKQTNEYRHPPPLRGGNTLGISRWGCAAGTMEPLPYARASLELSAYLQ